TARIAIPSNENAFAAAILTSDQSETFYGKCLNENLYVNWNNAYTAAEKKTKDKLALLAALSSYESSGLTNEEFNLLLGFDGKGGNYVGVKDTSRYSGGQWYYSSADDQRHALTQLLIWHYLGGWNEDLSYYINDRNWAINEFKEEHWANLVAVIDELYDKFIGASTAGPGYDVSYTQTGTAGQIIFSNVDQQGLTYLKQKVMIEWDDPNVTVFSGGNPVLSGDILELSNGLTLTVTAPSGEEPVFTLTDTIRYPIAETLYGLVLNSGSNQPLLIASCEFQSTAVKFAGSFSGGLTFINTYNPGGPIFPDAGGFGSDLLVTIGVTLIALVSLGCAGILVYRHRRGKKSLEKK
ncbi:MAG: thioester domain-containing protein, partial [Oscillospiraceae bacterium]|nr:thioester domain-containing protein [Oscillospiraceae bacterium]